VDQAQIRRLAAAALAFLLLAPSSAWPAERLQDVVVMPGDTLWSISNRWLDDPARWDELLKHNRLPSSDPTVALPGMTLHVPVRLIKAALRAARLTYYVNMVRRRPRDHAAWLDVSLGMNLYQGDTLRTHEDSRARVMLLNRELLSLEANSMAVLKPGGDSDLSLTRGSVFASRAKLVVGTARVTPRSADTRYSATVEPNLTTKVEVFRGSATVSANGGAVDVRAGMETLVAPGMLPSPPAPVRDIAQLEIRAQEYASSLTTGGGLAPDPRPALPPRAPEGDVEVIRGDISSLKIGQPIKGYHIQASSDTDFRRLEFDRVYDEGTRFVSEEVGLKPGTYWWRVAAIDLLGTEGRFHPPHYYTIGLKRRDTDEEVMAEMLQIIAPEENSETGADAVRAAGVLRDQRLILDINGVPVRTDEEGNFSITVRVKTGKTSVTFTLTDPKGNQSYVTRHVLKM
jgi:hypothetical protein